MVIAGSNAIATMRALVCRWSNGGRSSVGASWFAQSPCAPGMRVEETGGVPPGGSDIGWVKQIGKVHETVGIL